MGSVEVQPPHVVCCYPLLLTRDELMGAPTGEACYFLTCLFALPTIEVLCTEDYQCELVIGMIVAEGEKHHTAVQSIPLDELR